VLTSGTSAQAAAPIARREPARGIRPRQAGYTLIEIALVMVIVALFLGGMFVSVKSVMENAKTANLLGQIQDLASAARDFKSRYGYFPGDLPNAGSVLTADGTVSAGCSYAVAALVGNGIVDTATESRCALEHLVKARLLSKVELQGGAYVIAQPFGGGEVTLGVIAATRENAVTVTNLPCRIALQIDSKLDNASATPLSSGSVLGTDGTNLVTTCTPGGANDPVPVLLVRY
jgi:prepilin-type N-terminal cleavage/methylation domain-containing protein